MDRRSFLVGASGVALALAQPRLVLGGEATWHVMYPGTTTREDAAELLDLVASQLGPDVARHLQIARRGDTFVVIYDRSHLEKGYDRAVAEQVARRHAELLRGELDDDGPIATVVSSAELLDTWNIRYGDVSTSESRLKTAWKEVARILGSGVAKGLVIEKLPDGRFQLVYRRNGDRAGTEKVAAHHASLLRSSHLSAVAVRDQYERVSYDGSVADPGRKPAAPVAAPQPPPVAVAALAAVALPAPAPEEQEEEEVAAHDDTAALPGTGTGGTLRDLINTHVQRERAKGLVSPNERTAWVVHDLAADQLLAAINAEIPMQAASMIKPFVALAFFHQVEAGKLVYGPESTEQLERMLHDSSNTATNWFLEKLGGPSATAKLLARHYGDVVQQLELVEYIPSGGRTYRNKASAMDHARFLRALWKDGLPYAAELRRVMNLPGADRLYRDVPDIPVGTEVYNKTGTTAMCCGDMGILVARTRSGTTVPYILVGVIERSTRASHYTSWTHIRGDVIRSVSGLTYRYLKSMYDFA
jgi:beta-lactamase class A